MPSANRMYVGSSCSLFSRIVFWQSTTGKPVIVVPRVVANKTDTSSYMALTTRTQERFPPWKTLKIGVNRISVPASRRSLYTKMAWHTKLFLSSVCLTALLIYAWVPRHSSKSAITIEKSPYVTRSSKPAPLPSSSRWMSLTTDKTSDASSTPVVELVFIKPTPLFTVTKKSLIMSETCPCVLLQAWIDPYAKIVSESQLTMTCCKQTCSWLLVPFIPSSWRVVMRNPPIGVNLFSFSHRVFRQSILWEERRMRWKRVK